MKILLLHDVQAYRQNGVSVSLGILFTELKKLGHDVRLFTLSDTKQSFLDEEGNYYLGSVPALVYPDIRMQVKRRSDYVRDIIRWSPDVIHTNCEFSTFRIAKYIHEHCLKTAVWIHTFHTDWRYYIGPLRNSHLATDKAVPWFLTRCFHGVDALIVPTRKIYDYVKESHMADGQDVRIIPTGIDFSELAGAVPEGKEALKEALGFPAGAKVLIFLGRISVEKNLDELLSHFADYRKTHDNVYLLTVGDGPYKEALHHKVKKLHLKDRVVVHDGVAHREIRKYYGAADVFVSASESETQGLTFYEAMYCGLPVLAKDRVCLEDAVTEGENGAFFDDSPSFAAALDALLSKGDRGETKLPISFESEVFAKTVAALYREKCEEQNKA